jgi:hypothetical protein
VLGRVYSLQHDGDDARCIHRLPRAPMQPCDPC